VTSAAADLESLGSALNAAPAAAAPPSTGVLAGGNGGNAELIGDDVGNGGNGGNAGSWE
jgi:hypothetical protein